MEMPDGLVLASGWLKRMHPLLMLLILNAVRRSRSCTRESRMDHSKIRDGLISNGIPFDLFLSCHYRSIG